MATDPNLAAGIAAVQAGDLARAQPLLALVVKADPTSVDAWWWLAQAVTSAERRKFCLDRVLALDPRHAGAWEMLLPSGAPDAPEPPPFAPEPDPPAPDAIAALRATLPAPDLRPEPLPAGVSQLLQAAAEPAATLRAKVEGPAKELLATPLRLTRPQLLMLGGLTLALFICLGGLAFVVNPALRATLFGPVPVKALVLPTGTAVVYPTLPPEWTATPTRDPQAATATRLPSATPRASITPRVTATPVLTNLTDQVAAVQELIAAARDHMADAEYAEALEAWNGVLAVAPDYAYAHDQRGEAYRQGGDPRGSFSENSANALADYDEAIALDPSLGEYFLHRFYMFDALAGQSEYRIDRDHYNRLALASIQQANVLGNSDELSERYPAFVLAWLGECQPALQAFTALKAAYPLFSGGLNDGLALSYACQSNFAAALPYAELAVSRVQLEDWELDRAAILFQLGRYAEAEAVVDDLIDASGSFVCDCRYYLRAAINYAQGDPAAAQADLQLAQITVGRGDGLREYVLGHLALDAGDVPGAISYLQEAEARFRTVYAGLRTEVTADLATLESAPLDLTDIALPEPTPIVSHPVPQPDANEGRLRLRPADFYGDFVGPDGTGAFVLEPGETLSLQFEMAALPPGQAVDFRVYLTGPDMVFGEDSGILFRGWNQAENALYEFTINWGRSNLVDSDRFVTTTFDIFADLVNQTDQPLTVDNLTITIDGTDAPN